MFFYAGQNKDKILNATEQFWGGRQKILIIFEHFISTEDAHSFLLQPAFRFANNTFFFSSKGVFPKIWSHPAHTA